MNVNTDPSIDTMINCLVENLLSQLEIHQVLLDALKDEGSLPASCSLAELSEVQSVRDFAVRRIQELERIRRVLIEQYKKVQGIQHRLSLKEIIEQCDSPHRDHLLELREGLLQIISEIRPVGRRNAEIAVARISCFNEIQKVYDKSFDRVSTYSGNGVVTKAKGTSRMNRSI